MGRSFRSVPPRSVLNRCETYQFHGGVVSRRLSAWGGRNEIKIWGQDKTEQQSLWEQRPQWLRIDTSYIWCSSWVFLSTEDIVTRAAI